MSSTLAQGLIEFTAGCVATCVALYWAGSSRTYASVAEYGALMFGIFATLLSLATLWSFAP